MQAKSKIFYWYVVFVLIYLGLTLIPTPSATTLVKYHIGVTSLRLLDLTLIIPILVIWFAAFYGYSKLHAYTSLIKANRDGQQVLKLTRGLLVLAIGLPLNSIIASSLDLIAQHHSGFTAAATIISNYINVLYPLLAFLFISAGARGLSQISKSRPSLFAVNVVILIVLILGVVFCDLIAHAHHDLITSYHLSYGVVMLTLAIPYMYMWLLGLIAAVELYLYSRRVAGVVYRKSWNQLALGIAAIILIDIVLQYLSTLSDWLNALSLSGLLLLLYALLLLLAAAFIVVALGAKKLIRIEEA